MSESGEREREKESKRERERERMSYAESAYYIRHAYGQLYINHVDDKGYIILYDYDSRVYSLICFIFSDDRLVLFKSLFNRKIVEIE